MKKEKSSILENKKVRHDFEILESFVAGLVLRGWEVKSVRARTANLRAAWVSIDKNDEVFLKNFKISFYPFSNEVMDPERPKKLLLRRREIEKIKKMLNESGRTIVPTRIFVVGQNLKCEIAVVRGRKKHEKRQILRDREADREIFSRKF